MILEYIVSEIRYEDFKSSVNDWDLRRAFVEIWGTMAEYFGTGYNYE